ncbi:MAG: DNA repair protein RecO [Bacteroidetes bacterium]|jgi:DNA repair protein RecO (recombination protein O)|nr:DNA repair protein RecO [Bacteroidota bacterium]
MLSKLRGIIIGTIPYSESSLILRCYTDKMGLQSYMVSGIKGKSAAVKPAQLLPLTLVEMEVYHQQHKNLQRIKELKTTPTILQMHINMQKAAVAMFMAELIGKCIREDSEADEDLFNFIFNSVQILDLYEGSIANFPAFFMYRLCRYLGFDLILADFSHEPLEVYFKALANSSYQNLSTLAFSSDIRQQLLERLVRYYKLHYLFLGELKSPQVLNEVLS